MIVPVHVVKIMSQFCAQAEKPIMRKRTRYSRNATIGQKQFLNMKWKKFVPVNKMRKDKVFRSSPGLSLQKFV